MSSETPQRDIQRLVQRLARRIRVQRALEGLVTGSTLTVMVALFALVLFKTGWIDSSALWASFGASLAAPLALATLGWFRKLDPVSLAQRIDRTHDLHDRLSTALSISHSGPKNDFERAQLQDALRYVDRVDVAPAAPFTRPSEFVPLVLLAVALVGLVMLRPPSHQHALPEPPPIQHDAILDAATIAMEKNRLENLREELEGIEDPEVVALVDEIEKLIEDVEERKISEREFLERLQELEDKYFDAEKEEQLKRLTEKLKEAAEGVEEDLAKDLEQEEEVKELVEALKNEDLNAASKAMSKIAEKLMNQDLSDKQLERIAKLMEKFADKIDPNDPALQQLLEKNKDLIDKLSKKMQNNELSDQEKQRLNRAKEEFEKLQKQKQKQDESESTRELKRIRRSSKETSERATRKPSREDAEKKGKKDGEKGEQKGQEKKDEGNFKNEAGRKAKEAADSMKKKGQEQKKDSAKEMARKQLRDMKESMQRSGGKQGEGKEGEAKDEERGEAMREFIQRAKGKKEIGGEKGDEEGKEGSGKQNVAGAEGQSQSDDPFAGKIDGETNMAGKGKGGRELGEETSLDSKREDVKVDAKAGKGPSRSEIIRAASEEGFATTDYKDVYVDYSSVVEEVMEKENIPAGYRYYIKRYFQLIQPQE